MTDVNNPVNNDGGNLMNEPKVSQASSTTSTENATANTKNDDKSEVLDMGVTEVSEEVESDELIHYKELLASAHDSLDGKQISDLGIGHPYWGMMNQARAYKAEKGII